MRLNAFVTMSECNNAVGGSIERYDNFVYFNEMQLISNNNSISHFPFPWHFDWQYSNLLIVSFPHSPSSHEADCILPQTSGSSEREHPLTNYILK
jgi:hypothetical protein